MSPALRSDGPPSTSTPRAVAWRYDPTTVRWLRWLALVRTAVLSAAAAVVFVALAALVGATALLLGDLSPDAGGVLALAVALVVLRAARSPLGVLFLPEDERRSAAPHLTTHQPFSRRTRFAVAAPGALLVAVAAAAWPPLALALVGVGICAALLVAFVSTEARLDPETRSYVVEPGSFERSFDGFAGYARTRLGPLVLFRLRYPRRPGALSNARWIPVPAGHEGAAAAVLDATATDPDEREADDGRRSNPHVRLVAGALGAGLLALSVGGVVLVGGAYGWYLAALVGTFALLSLYVGVVEG